MSDSVSQFVKKNHSHYEDHLLREAHGLGALRRAAVGSGIDVPAVIHVARETLVMPCIRSVRCSAAQWQRLGQGLAAIHAQAQPRFGFEEDNYIGLNPQPNTFNDSWGSFFLQQRLAFQVGLIADQRRHRHFSQRLQQKAVRVQEFLDSESVIPSLVHGDLWNGNVLCGEDGRVWLIDPAIYYGDAEDGLGTGIISRSCRKGVGDLAQNYIPSTLRTGRSLKVLDIHQIQAHIAIKIYLLVGPERLSWRRSRADMFGPQPLIEDARPF